LELLFGVTIYNSLKMDTVSQVIMRGACIFTAAVNAAEQRRRYTSDVIQSL
jgi:hypothetical protein